jgi:hypothetical protein
VDIPKASDFLWLSECCGVSRRTYQPPADSRVSTTNREFSLLKRHTKITDATNTVDQPIIQRPSTKLGLYNS